MILQVLLERDIQHPQQEDLQLLPLPIVSVLYFPLCFGTVNISKMNDLAFHFVLGLQLTMENCPADCSLVSVIHLFVDVVYCLVSWTVGLPKRVVISTTYSSAVFSLTSHIAIKVVLS